MNRKLILFVLVALLLSGGAFVLVKKNSSHSDLQILLIGIDGGSIDILTRLGSENKLPNLQKLVETGALGHLDSLSWKKKVSGSHGYFSPIVWSTIATGKTPDKHGVEDFVLPLPGSVQFRMGYPKDTEVGNESVLAYPFHTRDIVTLAIQARAADQPNSIQLQVKFNDHPIGACELTGKYVEHRFEIPPQLVLWKDNRISFRYGATQKMGNKLVGADVDYIRLFDSDGQQINDYHPAHGHELFLSGWIYDAPLQISQASPYHFRTRTIWEILSKFNRRVAVVGWWATWPAFPVNGYLVSSQTGLQGERRVHIRNQDQSHLDVIPDLMYPADLVSEIKPLYTPKDDMVAEWNKRFFEMGKCGCVGWKQEKIVLERFWQDAFFSKIAQDLMDKHGDFDLFAVYFRGTDTMSHQFLGFADNPDYLKSACEGKTGCDLDRLRTAVDNYYVFVDQQIGELLKRRKSNTITFVITDHGEVSMGNKGNHKNNGFIIAQGPGIRKHTFENASVLDITPTILYLLNLPVAQDMDGNVMKEVLYKDLLQEKPLAYIDSYDRIVPATAHKVEVNQDLEERNNEELKALGYIN